jgi:hypothetical protein
MFYIAPLPPTCFFWAGTNERCLFGLSSTMACKNCRRNVDTWKMVVIWNLLLRHMECPNFHHTYLDVPNAEWVTCLKKWASFFWAYFIRIAKRNNFVEEIFSIRAHFRRENSIWKFKNNGFSGFLGGIQPERVVLL